MREEQLNLEVFKTHPQACRIARAEKLSMKVPTRMASSGVCHTRLPTKWVSGYILL